MLSKVKIIFVSFGLLNFGVQAKYSEEQIRELQNRQPGLTSKGVQRRLERANELIVQDNRKGAIEILEKMAEKENYRPFELGKIWQALAYAYAQTEKYDKARNAFKKSIEVNSLPYKPTLQSIFALAQLQVLAEKYDQAEKTLSDWFSLSKEEKPDAYVFSATIQFHKGLKKEALNSILKALSISKEPKENWLTFAVSLLYEEGRFKEASDMLLKLVELNVGKKMYWSQLAGTLLNQNKSMEALAVLDLALMLNLLDQEGEILNIVSLYLSNGLPFESSQLLEKAISKKLIKSDKKNMELLANSLIQAKEYDKAMAPLEKAASMSDDGKLFALKARLFLEKENFKEAIKFFDLALNKGLQKKMEGQVLVEKSIALIQTGQPQKALPLLNKALNYKESQKLAQSWRSYIEKL
ncbi:MAG: tetratricopeptide repeat protein [Bacteriovoracaceae bacterium]|nr:tetratricopeptide repeat protein [Bacteriovoracaceae bacterium]